MKQTKKDKEIYEEEEEGEESNEDQSIETFQHKDLTHEGQERADQKGEIKQSCANKP